MAHSLSLKGKVAIVGVGESNIGKVPGMTGLGLNAQASRRALDDAGLNVSDIDGLLTAYSFSESYTMLGSSLCEYMGLRPTMCASMVAGGASPGIMLRHAAQAIAMGTAETVLVCTGEARATGLGRDATIAVLTNVGHPQFEKPYGGSIPGFYAMVAKRHMHEYGTTREQLASVAVNTRAHAMLHPNAQMRVPLTKEQVLSAKPIAEPLGMLDCCLISDAAGAFIVTSAERAMDLKQKPVYLLGIGEMHTHEHLMCAPSLTHFGAADSGRIAYQMAGVTPADINVAQLYDCFTIVPVIELEELGFCKPGEGGAFFAQGHARIGSKLPVNTHGGMLSHAHAGAAGGLFGIVEAVRQLRGGLGERQVQGAELALVHNEGGILSSHCTMILSNQKG
jgi:acetyl-CoA acetyltransferase